jgi:hypothetical protein
MGTKTKVVLAVGGAVVLLAVAAGIVANHNANGGGPGNQGSSGPRPTLPPGEAPMEVIRPFSPEVAWNRPVSEFGPSEKYAGYAENFWKYGSFGGWTDPGRRGDIKLSLRDYSTPIYDARLATGMKQAYFADFGFPPSPGYSIDIPWNDTWKEASGNDGIIMMVNPDTGEHWSVWAYQRNNPSTCLNVANLANGFTPFKDLCVGGASKLMNEDGTVGDYRTWNGTQIRRGMGIPKLALVTTPYEVRAGSIDHALEMTVFNTMFGPACTEDEMDTPAMGSTCGFYLPPATRIEWQKAPANNCGENVQPATPATREKSVPEGMRFALEMTDAEIDAWLDSRGYTGQLRSTARIFAVALRDYGWIIAETGCYGMSIEVDGMVNPDAKVIWESLGLADTDDSTELLDGLFTEDRIYVVTPPEPFKSIKPTSPGRAG